MLAARERDPHRVPVREAPRRHPARARPRACRRAVVVPLRPRIQRLMSRLTHPAYRHRALQFLADAVLAAIAFALAFVLRFIDAGEIPERYVDMLLASVAFVAIGKAIIFTFLGPPREVVALLPDARLPGPAARDRAGQRRGGRRLHGRVCRSTTTCRARSSSSTSSSRPACWPAPASSRACGSSARRRSSASARLAAR